MSGENGIQLMPVERQHCPKCNTDCEHRLAETPTERPMFRCVNCGDVHVKHACAKRGSTIEANAAIMRAGEQTSRDGGKTWLHDKSGEAAGFVTTNPPAPVAPNDATTLIRERDRAQMPFDEIEKPAHYNQSDLEPIDVIEMWGLDFCLGNTVKYINRARYKGEELKDLKKAKWYLERRIKQLDQEQKQ